MKPSFLPAHLVESDSSSSYTFIERGLSYIQQGRFVEGAALLELACEHLQPHQAALAPVLEVLQATILKHAHVQQVLHEASRRFAESDAQQQVQVAALGKTLSLLVGEIDQKAQNVLQTPKACSDQRPLQLVPATRPLQDVQDQQRAQQEKQRKQLPALAITCFGHFKVSHVREDEQTIELCRNLKGQTLLRYLVAHPKHRETIDVLITTLWSDDEPEVARHKLQVAVSALRRSLNRGVIDEPGGGYILYKNQSYLLNPDVVIRSDVDEFVAKYQAGRRETHQEVALALYEQACMLYTGPFLAEDLYADWSFLQREELTKLYLFLCNKLADAHLNAGRYDETIRWATAILKQDRSDEEAHRQLISAYIRAGRGSEAVRQYQRCQRILKEELGVQPAPETQKLFEQY